MAKELQRSSVIKKYIYIYKNENKNKKIKNVEFTPLKVCTRMIRDLDVMPGFDEA